MSVENTRTDVLVPNPRTVRKSRKGTIRSRESYDESQVKCGKQKYVSRAETHTATSKLTRSTSWKGTMEKRLI